MFGISNLRNIAPSEYRPITESGKVPLPIGRLWSSHEIFYFTGGLILEASRHRRHSAESVYSYGRPFYFVSQISYPHDRNLGPILPMLSLLNIIPHPNYTFQLGSQQLVSGMNMRRNFRMNSSRSG